MGPSLTGRFGDGTMGMNQGVGISDRRKFLSSGAVMLGIGATGLIISSAVAAVAQSDDLGVLQTSRALEHEGIAAYQIAGKSGVLSPDTLKVALDRKSTRLNSSH